MSMEKALAPITDILELDNDLLGDIFDTEDEFTQLFLDYVRAQDDLLGAAFDALDGLTNPMTPTETRVRQAVRVTKSLNRRREVIDRMSSFGIGSKPWREDASM